MKMLSSQLSARVLLFSFLVVPFWMFATPAKAQAATISGKVSTGASVGIENATVSVKDSVTETEVGNATTDSSGNYTVSVDPGTYDIEATPPVGSGLTSSKASDYPVSGDTVVNFFLLSPGSAALSGHLYDALGNPLVDQRLRLNGNGSNYTTTTDASGNYLLQVPTGITYALFITEPSTPNAFSVNAPQKYTLRDAAIPLTEGKVLDITLPVKKVTIHVQDSSSNPVSGVRIDSPVDTANNQGLTLGDITNVTGLNGYNPGPVTDASGDADLWLFPNNNSYAYTFIATPPVGSGFLTTTLTGIPVTDDMTQVLTLQVPVTVSGHVYDALGNPLANQRVKLSFGGTQTQVVSDAAGSYSLTVSSGSYELVVEPVSPNGFSVSVPQQYMLRDGVVSLTGDKTLDITLPAKKVTVHVQDGSSNPISGVRVDVPYDTANNQGLTLGDVTNVTGLNGYNPGPVTDASGDADLWLFPNNNSYAYALIATPPIGSDFIATTQSGVTVTNDMTQTITLQKPVTLSGHLYDALRNPLAEQQVQLRQPSGFNVISTTDAVGAYTLDVVTGQYELIIERANQNNTSLNIPLQYVLRDGIISLSDDRTLDITLPLKQVTVHVQDQAQNPISGVRIDVPYDIVNNQGLTLGDVVNVTALNGYSSGPSTDGFGNATLWLFPNNNSYAYTFTAQPPAESIYQAFTLSNVVITSDRTEIISLQFVHDAPLTTATLSPVADGQGNYSDPTTVTLSATAVSGYSVANTYYTVDGGAQQNYSSPFTVSGNGLHTITFWSVDNIGVPETENTLNFTIASRQLTSLAPIQVWVGIKNSDAVGIKFDLKAEVYKDGVLVTSGQLDSVPGGSSGFGNANLNTIPFASFSPVDFPAGSNLSVKVSARNACVGSGKNSGTARLWFNDSAANSRFGATITPTTNDYYLLDGFSLGTSAGPGPKKNIDVAAGAKCSPFKEFGTWQVTP